MANDIQWQKKPLYGWGQGKQPTNFGSYARRLFSGWSTSNYVEYNGPDYNFVGSYMLQLHNAASIATTGGNARGTMPNSWIGPDTPGTYSGAVMTLVYPKANRRIAFYMDITHTSNSYDILITSKWYDATTGAIVTDVTYPGFGTGASFLDSMLVTAGTPGCLAIYDTVPGVGQLKGFALVTAGESGGSLWMSLTGWLIDIDRFTAKLQELYPAMDFSEYEAEEESEEAGPASVQAGYRGGTHDIWSSDSVGIPDLPSKSGSDLGFVHMYMPEAGDLQDLGSEIFPDFTWQAPTGNDVVDAILNVALTIPNIVDMFTNSKLIDYVQDVHLVPVIPQTSGNAQVKLGFRTMNMTCAVITSDYVSVPLGHINIREAEGQFLDYLPYTKAKLFLPFVGFVPVEPEYWQNGELGVTYHFNVRDGSFMAYVTSTPARVDGMVDHVIGQYSGNACIHIPITGLNYSSMVSGIIGGAAATMVGAASGNPAAAAAAALNTAAAAPQVQYSNSYNGSAAFMGCRVPYLMIERTVPHYPKSYSHDVGIPSRITTNLGSARGFVRVTDVDLSGLKATEAEKDEIRKLLAGGIYV